MPLVNAVLYGADDVVGAHVRSRLRQGPVPEFDLPHAAPDGTRLFVALGVVRPVDGKPTLLGGVIYHNLHTHAGKPVSIEASFAFDRPNWVSRDALRQLFGYPFVQLKCAVLVVQARRSNKRARRMNTGLGFELIGPIPHAFDGREDIMLYAMSREKCRWLKGYSNGQ